MQALTDRLGARLSLRPDPSLAEGRFEIVPE
jgi:hypothetical protein